MIKFILNINNTEEILDIGNQVNDYLFEEDEYTYTPIKIDINPQSNILLEKLKESSDSSAIINDTKYNILDFMENSGFLIILVSRTNISKTDLDIIDTLYKSKSNKLPSQSKREKFEDTDISFDEKETEIIDPSMINTYKGSETPLDDINKLIGILNIKDEVQNLYSLINYYKKMESRGLYVNNNSNMNMCFTGNPGTGKTTVARIITGILYQTGCIKKNKYIEVSGSDLKASFSGQTASKTKLIIKKAAGGVLFIDEAYSLYSDAKEDYGKEAISELLTSMENNRNNPVVIFAGYKQPIEKMISMNEGLRSRIGKYFEFENYDSDDLMRIFMSNIENGNLSIEKDALSRVLEIIKENKNKKNFSNARFVRNLYERILKEHSVNVENDDMLNVITLQDVTDLDSSKLN